MHDTDGTTRAADADQGRRQRQEAVEAEAASSSARGIVAGIQRAAGNRAAQLTVQRRAPWTGKVSEIDDELRAFFTSERKVLDLCRQLSPPEKRIVLAHFKTPMARALNFREMSQAVRSLGADLPTALDWLQAASIMTLAISYREIQPFIVGASQPERLALNTPRWKSFFGTVCNNQTIITAVQDLGFPLATALDWIRSEASALLSLNLAKLRPLITAASPDQRAAVATPQWQPFWGQVCTSQTMAELVDLLFPGNLAMKIRWIASVGTNWALIRGRIALAGAPEKLAFLTGGEVVPVLGPLLSVREFAEAVHMLGGTLAQRVPLLASKGWPAMRVGVEMTPASERLSLYADAAMQPLFLAKCTPQELVDAVGLIGGTLRQKLTWLIAKGVDPALLQGMFAAAPLPEKRALHGDAAILAWIQSLPDQAATNVIQWIGGTPAQQMTLFGATRPLTLLTWASPSQPWVDAIKASRANPLEFLALAGPNLAWAPFLRPHLASWFRGRADVVPGGDALNLVWAAYGDGSTFNAADTLVVWKAIYQRELWPAGTDKIFSKGTNAAGAGIRERYRSVAPTDAAARGFMAALRPIPRTQVQLAPIVFSDKYWDETLQADGTTWRGPQKDLVTSFYWQSTTVIQAKPGGEMNMVIINRDSEGTGTAFGGGSTVEGGTPLTYFQNHVRHEVGHAVGERRIGTMTTTGNDFAEAYGGWASSTQANFLATMWSAVAEPATGWPRMDFGSGPVPVNDTQVQAWLVGILATKSEVAGPIKNGANDVNQKLQTIAGATSLWKDQQLVKYLRAVAGSRTSPAAIQDAAYMFPGYTPSGSTVHIYSTRFGSTFATYSKAAYDQLHRSTGWYSLSSSAEMFAEIYTRKYSGAGLPGPVNSKDWSTFFDQLERQEDPMFAAPPPQSRGRGGLTPHPGP